MNTKLKICILFILISDINPFIIKKPKDVLVMNKPYYITEGVILTYKNLDCTEYSDTYCRFYRCKSIKKTYYKTFTNNDILDINTTLTIDKIKLNYDEYNDIYTYGNDIHICNWYTWNTFTFHNIYVSLKRIKIYYLLELNILLTDLDINTSKCFIDEYMCEPTKGTYLIWNKIEIEPETEITSKKIFTYVEDITVNDNKNVSFKIDSTCSENKIKNNNKTDQDLYIDKDNNKTDQALYIDKDNDNNKTYMLPCYNSTTSNVEIKSNSICVNNFILILIIIIIFIFAIISIFINIYLIIKNKKSKFSDHTYEKIKHNRKTINCNWYTLRK